MPVKKRKPAPSLSVRPYIAPAATGLVLILALLWQGAYFSTQFIFLLVVPFVALALSKRPIVLTRNAVLLTAFSLVMLASLLLGSHDLQVGLREFLRYLLLPGYLIFFVNTRDQSAWHMKAFFAGIFAVGLLGAMAYRGGIDIPGGLVVGSGRLQSTIQYANTTALLMLIGAMYAVHYYAQTKKWRYPLYTLGFLVCLYLTGSRTTLVLFFSIALLFAFTRLRRKARLIVLGGLVVAAAVLFAAGGRIVRLSLTEPTLIERVITWQDGFAIALGRPLLGLGLGNWQTDQFLYQSAPYGVRYIHNYYAHLLVDGGFPAAMLFVAALAGALWRGRKGLGVHFFVALAIAAHSFLDFDMQFGSVILILMFSLAHMPDREIRLPQSLPQIGKKRLRRVALVPAVCVMVMWVAEFGYVTPDPLGTRFLQAQQMAESGQYLEAIEETEALLGLWRFNEGYQSFYEDVLIQSEQKGIISAGERHEKLRLMEQSILAVNPLYTRYIARLP